MKLSEFKKIVREELQKIVQERRSIVPSREPPRKMSKPQVSKRTSDGAAAISKTKDKARAEKLKAGGNDEADIFWAAMTNNALGDKKSTKDHVEPKGGTMIQENQIIRLRDIASVVTLPNIASITEALPSELPDDAMSGNMDEPSSMNSDTEEEEHAKAKLMRMHKQTAALYNMLGDVDETEEWVISKIRDAAECLNSAYNHIEYQKTKPSALGNGEGTPADSAGI
jgi:hypothetical protein